MSKTIKPALLGGFQDILPEDMISEQKVMNTIRRVYESFGFTPLDTPGMERLPVLIGDTETFNKSIFVAKIKTGLEDRGQDMGADQDFALRFDLTVSLARVVAAYPQLPKPFKRYQIGKVWRGERPQEGRFREFTQFDADIIGTRSMLADTEIIQVISAVMEALGFSEYLIRFNSRKILNGLAELVGCADRSKEFDRIIDKVDRDGIESVVKELRNQKEEEGAGRSSFSKVTGSAFSLTLGEEQLALVRTFLEMRGLPAQVTFEKLKVLFDGKSVIGLQGVRELEEIVSNLAALGFKEGRWVIDLSVARGLDYYTGPVFETVVSGEEAIGSVFSGGRFDGLSNRFLPGSNIPGVGASVGLSRLLVVMKKRGMLPKRKTLTQVLVTIFNQSEKAGPLKIASALREEGVNAELYIDDRPLRAQIAYAVSQEIPFVIIAGPEEQRLDKVVLKDLIYRSQEILTLEECLAKVRAGTSVQ